MCRKAGKMAVLSRCCVRAHQWLGKGPRENIGRCCRCNEERHVNKKTGKVNTDHRYMGIRFYFDSDSEWMKKIKQ